MDAIWQLIPWWHLEKNRNIRYHYHQLSGTARLRYFPSCQIQSWLFVLIVWFIYFEKVAKFCKISTVDLTGSTGQIYIGDLAFL